MADKRINALANTAPSTASDDFIAVDGTTNGTRKLNAFSPTFGGNATVTGTLTVNGTNASSIPRLSLNSPVSETYNFAAINTIQSADVSLEVTSTAATGVGLGVVVRRTNGGEFARFINGAVTTRLANMACDAAGTYFSISSAVGMYLDSTKTMLTGGNVLIGGSTDIPGTGGLKVFGTTASTSTSSGALVVSGGVGVAGNINGGGAILAQGALGSIPAVNYLSTELSSGQGYITCYNGSGSAYLALNYRASQHNFTSNGAVAVQSTTASTSTSSGALVVSGGVGVAGAIFAGGAITTGNDGSNVSLYVPGDTAIRTKDGSSTKLYIDTKATDGGDIVFRPRVSTALTLAAATGNATFGGNITTAAPAGGTAAAWKLGTVASVSPTSPNRTIEVDIGGTIYYIHAKTTNN